MYLTVYILLVGCIASICLIIGFIIKCKRQRKEQKRYLAKKRGSTVTVIKSISIGNNDNTDGKGKQKEHIYSTDTSVTSVQYGNIRGEQGDSNDSKRKGNKNKKTKIKSPRIVPHFGSPNSQSQDEQLAVEMATVEADKKYDATPGDNGHANAIKFLIDIHEEDEEGDHDNAQIVYKHSSNASMSIENLQLAMNSNSKNNNNNNVNRLMPIPSASRASPETPASPVLEMLNAPREPRLSVDLNSNEVSMHIQYQYHVLYVCDIISMLFE